MRDRILRLGFWSGFGRMMAGGLALYFAVYLLADTDSATPFSIMAALALWTFFSIIAGIGGRDAANRLLRDEIEPRINPNKETAK
jgi:hypothetical protein